MAEFIVFNRIETVNTDSYRKDFIELETILNSEEIYKLTSTLKGKGLSGHYELTTKNGDVFWISEKTYLDIKKRLCGMGCKQDTQIVEPVSEPEPIVKVSKNGWLKLRIEKLNLPIRVKNSCIANRISTLNDLVSHTERQLLTMNGFGRVSVNNIKNYLSEHNLKLAE